MSRRRIYGGMLHEEERAETLAERFSAMADVCSRFSRAVIHDLPTAAAMRPLEHERQNLTIVRAMLAKWSLEILSILYVGRRVAYQDIKKELGISANVLSTKLVHMERLGLVSREVSSTRLPRVYYSLTDKGLHVVKLGEPVLLYLRFTEGYLIEVTQTHDHPRAPKEDPMEAGSRKPKKIGSRWVGMDLVHSVSSVRTTPKVSPR